MLGEEIEEKGNVDSPSAGEWQATKSPLGLRSKNYLQI